MEAHKSIIEAVLFLADEEKAKLKNRFFKNKEGEYGFGDAFLGVSNPEIHQICKEFKNKVNLDDIEKLIANQYHEIRFTALSLMVLMYKKQKTEEGKKAIVDVYLNSVKFINNWDLVDCSCYYILGDYFLLKSDKSILYKFANSSHLWSQRIAMVSCLGFIRKKSFDDTFKLADILLQHPEDIIQKAVGWMLKVAWEKGAKADVESYLTKNIIIIPRTTLRYAIEKMEEKERKAFLIMK